MKKATNDPVMMSENLMGISKSEKIARMTQQPVSQKLYKIELRDCKKLRKKVAESLTLAGLKNRECVAKLLESK